MMGRYALQGGRWNVMDLTYRVTKYPSRNLNQRQVLLLHTSSRPVNRLTKR